MFGEFSATFIHPRATEQNDNVIFIICWHQTSFKGALSSFGRKLEWQEYKKV